MRICCILVYIPDVFFQFFSSLLIVRKKFFLIAPGSERVRVSIPKGWSEIQTELSLVVGTVLSELILLCSMNIVCGLLKHFFFRSSWGESWGEQVSLIFFFLRGGKSQRERHSIFRVASISRDSSLAWHTTRVTHHSRDSPLAFASLFLRAWRLARRLACLMPRDCCGELN